MSTAIEELIEKALQLSREYRAFMAEKLLESLDHGEEFEVSPEWLAETKRRCQEIDSGKATLLDAERVFDEVDEALG
ncbi:MAG: addiction module protein [Deltaproteobacteria bacterium]|nr:addiction module protein [Deltaproteobacteria bacterium]